MKNPHALYHSCGRGCGWGYGQILNAEGTCMHAAASYTDACMRSHDLACMTIEDPALCTGDAAWSCMH